MKNILTTLKTRQHICITTHENPDLDAIGSCLAFQALCQKIEKTCTIVIADDIEQNCRFLPGVDSIQQEHPKDYDCLVVLDASNLKRVKDIDKFKLTEHRPKIINIDHHPDNDHFGHLNLTENRSSVGEILSHHFIRCSIPISADMATCLYAAISFDTGRFLFGNTTAETMALAAKLIEYGADAFAISQAMYENKSLNAFKCIEIALKNMVTDEQHGLLYTVMPKTAPDSDIKMVDFIRQLQGYPVVVVFQEKEDDMVRINLRSKNSFNVSDFAREFGGGGHKQASGIAFKGSLTSCMNTILPKLKAALD